jgi:proliferating cell nuclear antigen
MQNQITNQTSQNPNHKKNILYLRTLYVIPFKTMTEVLSNVLTETTWVIHGPDPTKPDKFVGLEIATADTSRTIYIRVKLDAKEFTEYYCKYEKYELGISLHNLYKLLKSVDKDDILSMYVEENDKQNLIMEIENQDKKSKTFYKLKLMDLDHQPKKSKMQEFDVKITMPSGEFHKLFREMNIIAEYVEIKCTSKSIIFTCKGDCAERSTIYKSEEGGLNISNENKKTQNIVQGIYEIKNIVLFTKCASLCNDLEIYMKNDFALTIKYTIATLGTITIALSPIKEENIKNISYSYSDDEDDINVIGNNTKKLQFDKDE